MKKKSMILSGITCAGIVAASLSVDAIASSAEEADTAYLFIRSVSEEARYEDDGATVNTLSDGVTTATITADGDYTVSIDLGAEEDVDTIDEISVLQLQIVTEQDIEITLDNVKIDGEEVELTDEATVQTADDGSSYYIDLCNINGENLFDRKEYQDITTISVDFSVSGWVEETVEEEEEESEEEEDETASIAENPATGDNTGVSVVVAVAGAALIAVIAGTVIKKRK